jgi:hypothetical protein
MEFLHGFLLRQASRALRAAGSKKAQIAFVRRLFCAAQPVKLKTSEKSLYINRFMLPVSILAGAVREIQYARSAPGM